MNEKEAKELFPKPEWFNQRELDEKLKIFEYTVSDKPCKVAFYIRSLTKDDIRLINADNSERNELTGMDIVDQEGVSDDMICYATSYEVDGKRVNLSKDELQKIKQNKKNGLYTQLLTAVLDQSEAKSQKEIDHQKNSDGPTASSPSS